jgi:hypothetical protein
MFRDLEWHSAQICSFSIPLHCSDLFSCKKLDNAFEDVEMTIKKKMEQFERLDSDYNADPNLATQKLML